MKIEQFKRANELAEELAELAKIKDTASLCTKMKMPSGWSNEVFFRAENGAQQKFLFGIKDGINSEAERLLLKIYNEEVNACLHAIIHRLQLEIDKRESEFEKL